MYEHTKATCFFSSFVLLQPRMLSNKFLHLLQKVINFFLHEALTRFLCRHILLAFITKKNPLILQHHTCHIFTYTFSMK